LLRPMLMDSLRTRFSCFPGAPAGMHVTLSVITTERLTHLFSPQDHDLCRGEYMTELSDLGATLR